MGSRIRRRSNANPPLSDRDHANAANARTTTIPIAASKKGR